MKVKDVAARLELAPGSIYGLVAAGKLKCHRVGLGKGRIRITEEHLVDLWDEEIRPLYEEAGWTTEREYMYIRWPKITLMSI